MPLKVAQHYVAAKAANQQTRFARPILHEQPMSKSTWSLQRPRISPGHMPVNIKVW
jgi:hypothetical protein